MKQHLIVFVLGLIIFLAGFICLNVEFDNYKKSEILPSSFKIEQNIIEYKITNNKIIKITNDDTNINMNAFIDNSLLDEIRIVYSYPTMSDVEYEYKEVNSKNKLHINFESEVVIDLDSIKKLANLGISTLKDKMIYNYTLLEYPEIKVYVHENYRENIRFVGKYGKEYIPIK